MLTRLFFERPWLLLVILVAVNIALIAVWSRLRSRQSAHLVWAGLAAIPVLFCLSLLVVTPSEQIIALCNRLAAAVESGDLATIRQHLAGDFEAADLDASAFMDRVERTLTTHHVLDPRLRGFEMEFPSDSTGVVTFNATCRVESLEGYFDRLPSRWRITWRRSGDSWRITTVETLPVPPLNARDIHELLR